MPNQKISQLTVAAAPLDADLFYLSKAAGGPLDRSVSALALKTYVGGAIHYVNTVITDAQIKALPTTPITVVAAPGAGKTHYLHSAILRVDCTAGIYTNIAADNSQLGLTFNDVFSNLSLMYNMTVPNSPDGIAHGQITDFLTNASFPMVYYQQQPAMQIMFAADAYPLTQNNSDDSPITISSLNEFDGNYTGGNAANTMTIMCWYSTLNFVTGAFE
jgi:hypothetical protein